MDKNESDVVVVAIEKYSWETLIKKKFFAFPKGSRRVCKYFAFYRKGEIANYAEVKGVTEGEKKDVGIGYWLYCFPDAEPPFEIVKFKTMKKLEPPIKKDGVRGRGHVQGRIYTTLKKLLKAKKVSDLL